MKVGLISLGCPKNLTDSEVILGKLFNSGYDITNRLNEADIIIINTCAFIKEAKEEAIDTILDVLYKKRKNQKLIVAGCLPQRYKKKLIKLLPEVDGWIGSGSIDRIVEFLNSKKILEVSKEGSCLFDEKTPRIKITPKWYSYIKISDGCSNRCSYCAVPLIRGDFKSRPMESILNEAKGLAESGTKEIILVAHDTTMYGKDIYGEFMLPKLIKKLSKIEGIEWIRIMYAHPKHVTDKLIDTIANESKVCKYLDLPIQHICDRILYLMGRGVGRFYIENLIAKLRRSIPNITLRTSLIVGFPTESKRDFLELVQFIKDVRFERLGIFTYSEEDGTGAKRIRGKVPEKVKLERFNTLMQIQNRISKEINKSMVGKKFKILIEENRKNSSIGRSEMDAPLIDGSVILKDLKISPGRFVEARITSASAYNLFGKLST